MPTTVTKTIKSAGGDYTSLSAWEAAQQANLVTLDEIRQAECHGFDDTTGNVVITGWTTDATRFIRIFAASGAGHGGIEKASSAGGGANYRLIDSTNTRLLDIDEDFVRIEGIEFRTTRTNTLTNISIANAAFGVGATHYFDNCIFYWATAAQGSAINASIANLTTYVRNCLIIYGGAASGTQFGAFTFSAGVGRVQNCTIVNRGSGATIGVSSTSGMEIKNTAVLGFATCFDSPTTTPTGDHNASSDATADDDFTNSLINLVTADQFVSTTAGAENYHLKAGNSLEGAGAPVSGLTLDIDGDARDSSAPDIGFDEIVAETATYEEAIAATITTNITLDATIGIVDAVSFSTVMGYISADSLESSGSIIAAITTTYALADSLESSNAIAVGVVAGYALAESLDASDFINLPAIMNFAIEYGAVEEQIFLGVITEFDLAVESLLGDVLVLGVDVDAIFSTLIEAQDTVLYDTIVTAELLDAVDAQDMIALGPVIDMFLIDNAEVGNSVALAVALGISPTSGGSIYDEVVSMDTNQMINAAGELYIPSPAHGGMAVRRRRRA